MSLKNDPAHKQLRRIQAILEERHGTKVSFITIARVLVRREVARMHSRDGDIDATHSLSLNRQVLQEIERQKERVYQDQRQREQRAERGQQERSDSQE